MKNLISPLILLAAISSSFATAGTPDQDLLVKDLRDRFSKASVPIADTLVSTKWKCWARFAEKNVFQEDTYEATFSEFHGYIRQTVPCAGCSASNPNMLDMTMINNGSEFIGESKHWILSYRIDKNGELIGEASRDAERVTYYLETVLDPIAASSQGSKVAVYSVCTKNP